MVNREDLFELCLQELEAGTPLDELVARLPEEAADLASMLALAAAMRALPQPAPAPERSTRQWRRVLSIFFSGQGLRWRTPGRPGAGWAGRLTASLAGLAAVAFLIWAAVLAGRPSVALAAVVTEAAGQVEVDSSAPGEDWRPAIPGDRLQAGVRLRTGEASGATLTFADGSLTRLLANSEVMLVTLTGGPDSPQAVQLTQRSGWTTHDVAPRALEASFVVETPAGAAVVQGTIFSVFVDAAGQTRFAVDAGQVQVMAAGEVVLLSAGQVTMAFPGRTPGLPANEFRESGPITRMEGITWTIGGVPIRVSDDTTVVGRPSIGASVSVLGRVLANGVWLADRVEVVSNSSATASFTGMLEAAGPGAWRIGGASVVVSDQTSMAGGPEVGRLVRVTFLILPDGRWQAMTIEGLNGGLPAARQGPRRPSLEFEPDELLASVCQEDVSIAGRLLNDGEPPNDDGSEVRLNYTVTRGAEFMETVRIDPDNWGIILAGEAVSFDVNLRLNERWAEAPDGAEVKVRVSVGSETDPAAQSPARLTVTLVRHCRAAPILAATATAAVATDPLEPAATPTPASGPANNPICLGTTSHPIVSALAEQFKVTYAEIAHWFCSGFGFGEIRLAYEISAQTGQIDTLIPVAEIFALRQTGMGWGEIMIQLGLLPSANSPAPRDDDDPEGPPPFGPPAGVPTGGPPPGVQP